MKGNKERDKTGKGREIREREIPIEGETEKQTDRQREREGDRKR